MCRVQFAPLAGLDQDDFVCFVQRQVAQQSRPQSICFRLFQTSGFPPSLVSGYLWPNRIKQNGTGA